MPIKQQGYVRHVDADAVKLMNPSAVECLRYKKTSAGVTDLYGQSSTTNNLRVRANSADVFPYLELLGNSHVTANAPTGSGFIIKINNINTLYLNGAGIENVVTDADLYLGTTGTGVVKFGTKTGTGDVAVDGYVSIKDAAGAAVKLATVA